MPMDRSKYPPDWDRIAAEVKRDAGWRCQTCNRPHRRDIPAQILTVHHRDGVESNCDKSNLVALCAACHLRAQGELARLKRREQFNLEQRSLF